MLKLWRRYLQARRDQASAIYPGCERGHANCMRLTCACREATPSMKFIWARMRRLKEYDSWSK